MKICWFWFELKLLLVDIARSVRLSGEVTRVSQRFGMLTIVSADGYWNQQLICAGSGNVKLLDFEAFEESLCERSAANEFQVTKLDRVEVQLVDPRIPESQFTYDMY
ncbi:hypothetical protein F511_22145 [Dorcoceras hygrometricum]|uniref:Uncharacterized protein n=1 Tax=Dorcoceras hygrometricum TaxID=472368 RepID=A0A2Z7B456_9LAMI|nr:hypothetical protein F511_22145 [Dorcoceras hygrometricum]